MLTSVLAILDIHTVLVFTVVLLAVWLYRSTKLPPNFPPGPRQWPLIGNLDMLAEDPFEVLTTMKDLSGRYGPIVGLKLGNYPAVIINDVDTFKQSLIGNTESYSHRPHFMHVLGVLTYKRGVSWHNGPGWRDSRKFVLRNMKAFGMGKKIAETRVQEEADLFCKELARLGPGPFDPTVLVQQAVSNIICQFLFSTRFEYQDPKFNQIMDWSNVFSQVPGFTSPTNFFAPLRLLPFKWMSSGVQSVLEIEDFIDSQIEQHRLNFDPKNIRDFTDMYLEREPLDLPDHDPYTDVYSRKNLRKILWDVFSGGTESTSGSLRWFLLWMVVHPDVQRRCQEEIDRVVGTRRITVADKADLPYTEATLHEVQRVSNAVPFTAHQTVRHGVDLCGYTLPKDTMIIPNLFAFHNDPRKWRNPEQFNPERWLDKEGKFQKRESYMPFAGGPRACPGEPLAKVELFLFFTNMLQRLTLEAPDPKNPPKIGGNNGIILTPKKYEIMVYQR